MTNFIMVMSDEYEKINRLAGLTERQIQKRAVQIAQKMVNRTLDIHVHLHETTDYLEDTITLRANVSATESAYTLSEQFLLPMEQRKEVAALAKRFIEKAMVYRFGETIKEMNKYRKLRLALKLRFMMMVIFSSAGWLLALCLFLHTLN